MLLALQCSVLHGQKNVLTVGLQYKPMLNTKFLNSGGGVSTTDWIQGDFNTNGGSSMGMVIRRGFTETLSLETGISYVKRNFQIDVLDLDSLYEASMNFALISYQIPMQGLVYARLTDKLWMNASGGVGLNILPSDVQTNEFEHRQRTVRLGKPDWLRLSILANYGFEYRTKDSGFFYLGASFDRPFSDLLFSQATIRRSDGVTNSTTGVFSGSYLTIDFRYFFHEDPDRKLSKPSKRR